MNATNGRWIRTALLCMALVLVPSVSDADGKFFATEQAKDPSTPFQRGLVSLRGGVETLIVESTIDGASGEYAWVVPVPAKPISIRAVGPGALESAVRILSPPVETTPSASPLEAAVVLILVTAMAHWAIRRGHSAVRLIVEVMIAIVLLALAYTFFAPVYASANAGFAQEPVIRFGEIGSYNVDIVRSNSPDTVVHSLRDLGARAGEAEEAVMRSYSKDGWAFVVARLRKNGNDLAAPHPLRIDFPAKQAVYPMRLTGVNARRLTLQLVVFGPATASCAPLELWRSTQAQAAAPMAGHEPWRVSSSRFRPIGHPDLSPLLWEDATVSYLKADLDEDAMHRDLQISWTDTREYAKPLYTPQARTWSAVALFLYGWAGVCLAATAYGMWRKWSAKRTWRLALGFGAIVALVVALISAQAMEVVESEPGHRYRTVVKHRRLLQAIQSFRWDRKAPFPERLEAHLAEIVGKTGQVRSGNRDVPGGYTVRKSGSTWIVTVYDETAAARSMSFDGP